MELALACDLCVASDKARFGLPEIKLGVLPGGGGTVRLAQIAGLTVARALAMSGDVISAERAYQIGLVHAVYPAAEVSSSTLALAEQLASLPPIAMAQLKSVFNSIADASAQGSFIVERKGFAICFATEDQKEGTKAFLEKRQPTFIGR
jgi:enoyl-CoA hydratase